MNVTALVAWVAAALGGFYLLATWLQSGGMRQQRRGPTRFPAALVFGHFLLAGIGLLVWLVYLYDDRERTARLALGLITVTALLGFVMLARWLSGRRRYPVRAGTRTSYGAEVVGLPAEEVELPAEQHFPVISVVAHGALAALTVALVLIEAIGS